MYPNLPKLLYHSYPLPTIIIINYFMGIWLIYFFLADNWPHFECQIGERHPSDACCRCDRNNHWECNLLRQHCARNARRCPTDLQVTVPGECCPSCLQARQNTAPSQNYPSPNTNHGSQQDECKFHS